LLRRSLVAAVQARIEAAEQKGGRPASAPVRAGTPASPRDCTSVQPGPPWGRLPWAVGISSVRPAVKATSVLIACSAWTAT
jgi:hypothetical protein